MDSMAARADSNCASVNSLPDPEMASSMNQSKSTMLKYQNMAAMVLIMIKASGNSLLGR